MHITKVSAMLVNANLRNWVFVRVDTSEPGLYGLGEATLEFQSRAVAARVDEFEELLLNKDPRDITMLWEAMFRYPFFRGGAVTMSAISGIDQALHDIQAKALGVPLWRVLGGLARTRVQMYDHVGGGDSSAVYGDLDEGIAERVSASKAEGFSAIKILAVPKTRAIDGIGHSVKPKELCTQRARRVVRTWTSWSIFTAEQRRRWPSNTRESSNRLIRSSLKKSLVQKSPPKKWREWRSPLSFLLPRESASFIARSSSLC